MSVPPPLPPGDWDIQADARATKWGLFGQLILTLVLYVVPGLTPTFGLALTVTWWTLVAWVVTLVVCFFWSFALINRQKRAVFVPMVGCAVTALIFVVYLYLTTVLKSA